jgi:hypothetical protein
LLELLLGKKYMGLWNHFVAVYMNDQHYREPYPVRITERTTNYLNARLADVGEVLAFR